VFAISFLCSFECSVCALEHIRFTHQSQVILPNLIHIRPKAYMFVGVKPIYVSS